MPTHHRHLLPILFALLMSLSFATLVKAGQDRVSYMLDEPVFNGQSYIVEAGRQHQQMIVLVQRIRLIKLLSHPDKLLKTYCLQSHIQIDFQLHMPHQLFLTVLNRRL